METTISTHYKTKQCKNPLSGHEWIEEVGSPTHYTIHGNYSIDNTRYRSFEKAEKSAIEHDNFMKKFPWECPRSDRELNKAKKLGLM